MLLGITQQLSIEFFEDLLLFCEGVAMTKTYLEEILLEGFFLFQNKYLKDFLIEPLDVFLKHKIRREMSEEK